MDNTTIKLQLQVVVTGRSRGDLPLGQMRDRIEAAGGSMSVTAYAEQTVIEVRAAEQAAEPSRSARDG